MSFAPIKPIPHSLPSEGIQRIFLHSESRMVDRLGLVITVGINLVGSRRQKNRSKIIDDLCHDILRFNRRGTSTNRAGAAQTNSVAAVAGVTVVLLVAAEELLHDPYELHALGNHPMLRVL
jgi:hypothetical protein